MRTSTEWIQRVSSRAFCFPQFSLVSFLDKKGKSMYWFDNSRNINLGQRNDGRSNSSLPKSWRNSQEIYSGMLIKQNQNIKQNVFWKVDVGWTLTLSINKSRNVYILFTLDEQINQKTKLQKISQMGRRILTVPLVDAVKEAETKNWILFETVDSI